MSLPLLREADFSKYPPEARKVATEHVALLQLLPPSFAGLLLREVVNYDWRFPAERTEIDGQLRFLGSLSHGQLKAVMAAFAALPIASSEKTPRWGADPIGFTEDLTAQLWAGHAMDRFRAAAEAYQHQLRLSVPEPMPAVPRLCVVVVGKDAPPGHLRLFRKLRPHGTYFTQVNPQDGLESLFRAVNARVQANPSPYVHWYVDGGAASMAASNQLTTVSYAALDPVREALLSKIDTMKSSGSVVGPEDLRSLLAELHPNQLKAGTASPDALLRHFELNLLTEGSGTQIFSTTFVQWGAREILRRAKPLTLITRYSPRQKQRPMNEMLATTKRQFEYDPVGSLEDADMGAFYTWINLTRLSGAETASFIAWFEDQHEAIAIAPAMAQGTTSSAPCNLSQILKWVS